MSIESMMPSSVAPFSSFPQSFPASEFFFQGLSHSSPKYTFLFHPKGRRSMSVQDLMLGGWFSVLLHLSLDTLLLLLPLPMDTSCSSAQWEFQSCIIFAIKACAWFSSMNLSHDCISIPLTPLGPQFLDNFSYSQ